MTPEQKIQFDQEIEKFKNNCKKILSTVFLTKLDGKVIYANIMAERRTFLKMDPAREKIRNEIWTRLTPMEYQKEMLHIATIDKLPYSADFNNRIINDEHEFQQFNLIPIVDDAKGLTPPEDVIFLVVIIPELRDKTLIDEFRTSIVKYLGDQDMEPNPLLAMQNLNMIMNTYLIPKEEPWDISELEEER